MRCNFALPFGMVMFEIRLPREITAKTHREPASRDLGEAGGYNDRRRGHGPGKARRKSERNREPIRHSDHDIADKGRGGKVLFDMRRRWHAAPEGSLRRQRRKRDDELA